MYFFGLQSQCISSNFLSGKIEVLRSPFFPNNKCLTCLYLKKHPLKASNKRTHIALLINLFISLIEREHTELFDTYTWYTVQCLFLLSSINFHLVILIFVKSRLCQICNNFHLYFNNAVFEQFNFLGSISITIMTYCCKGALSRAQKKNIK